MKKVGIRGMTMEKQRHFLFIGNSATYVNDIPGMLAALCGKMGIQITQKQIAFGGRFLKHHAEDPAVIAEIAKGYDAVFLQENGNAMLTEEARAASEAACKKLVGAAHQAGSRCYFYVRPPYEKPLGSYHCFEQCALFDDHFTPMAEQWGVRCVYVNRAFAYAIKHHGMILWGEDHAHTNTCGAYLAVCSFYASIFGRSATELDNGYNIPKQEAALLQKIADKIALEGVIPWKE